MNLTELQKMGAFTGAPVKKSVTWKQGDDELTADVYVRRLSYGAAIEDAKALAGSQEILAGRIAASICDENGQPVFTAADITGEADPERGPLNHALTMALLAVISEVNHPPKKQTSRRKKKSGTS
jgi:hypothetical protein